MLSKPVVVVIGLSIPFNANLSMHDDKICDMKVYVSPTLNQPYDTYTEKQNRELLEKIFIDHIKDAK